MPAPKGGKEEVLTWQTEAKDKLMELLALKQFTYYKPLPLLLESIKMDGFKRDKLIIRTEEKLWMPFFALVPSDAEEGKKRPSVIAFPNDSAGKFSVAPSDDYEAIRKLRTKALILPREKRRAFGLNMS